MREQTGFDYEQTDIASVSIAWIATGMALFIVITPLLMPLAFPQSMQHRSPTAPPTLSAHAPPLEVTPQAALQRFQRGETQLTDTYGWVDRQRGQVRIPVAEAMRALLHKGLPGWPSP